MYSCLPMDDIANYWFVHEEPDADPMEYGEAHKLMHSDYNRENPILRASALEEFIE